MNTPRYTIEIKATIGDWFDVFSVVLLMGPFMATEQIPLWMHLLLAAPVLVTSILLFTRQRRHALGTRIQFYGRDRIVVLSGSGKVLAEGTRSTLQLDVGTRDGKTYFYGYADGFFVVELRRGEESILQRFGVLSSGNGAPRMFSRNRHISVALVVVSWVAFSLRWLLG